jgi:predicted hotdog family 3-hydroxylacyl-ACP dehydratase
MEQRNRTGESAAPDRRRLGPEILAERRAPDRWEQDLRVPANLGCWPGHFPDRPILPGVLQLDWAIQLLARWLGGEAWPRRVEGLKFKQLIRPGQALTLALEREAGGGGFRFGIAHGATIFSLGRIVVENVAPFASSGEKATPACVPEFPALAELLPHAGAMVLLARVASHAGDATVCVAEIGDDALFGNASGDVPAWMGLEYMAQCIAAHSGLRGLAGGEPPRVGFLVGSRRMTFHVRLFRRGQMLTVQARQVWGGAKGMVAFDCNMADADTGELLAEGRLGCFIPGDDTAGDET